MVLLCLRLSTLHKEGLKRWTIWKPVQECASAVLCGKEPFGCIFEHQ